MNRKIDALLRELIALDPSFKAHESHMRTLIAELLQKKPDTQLDEQFVANLRSQLQLQSAPTPSPVAWYSYMSVAMVAALALAVVLPLGYYMTNGTDPAPGGAVFSMEQQIETLQEGAYGTLALQGGGLGGGSMRDTAALAQESGNYAPSMLSTDMGMGSSDARMIAPDGPITTYSYVYTGEPLELSDSKGDVYRKTQGQNASGQIASQLRKFNFGLIDLGAYSTARVRSFELVEDKAMGYSINVNFDEGTISINPNYNSWPTLSGKEMAVQPLPASAMPGNDEVLRIANRFMEDHNINLANYGDPIVQDYSHMSLAADAQLQYAPEQITVTYPLKIEGTEVYQDAAYPYGIQVGVSVRDKRVMSVYGLSSQTFSSSSYALETDSAKILSVLSKGGPNAWVPEPSTGLEIKNVEIEVGTPEKVLMHTYNYANNESQELFVPALSFPVTKAPEGEQYYPKSILIPLVPELLNQQPDVVIYDMLR